MQVKIASTSDSVLVTPVNMFWSWTGEQNRENYQRLWIHNHYLSDLVFSMYKGASNSDAQKSRVKLKYNVSYQTVF